MNTKDIERRIYHACDILRRDDNTKLITKYIEHVSWLLFLKAYEAVEEEQALLVDSYTPVFDSRYRWSTWTQKGLRAEELVAWVTDDLFPYLRSLKTTERGRLIGTIFEGVTVVTKSGYNLRDVIAEIDHVDFHAADDVYVLSVVYESLLGRLGEAGTSGEHYTPRPIVRLMVHATDPRIGERVYDPACGSAGFLVEAFDYMRPQERTTRDAEVLQHASFFGQESGELPYLIGTMNSILHGIVNPNIVRTNTLERDVRAISGTDLYDIILTNPPFGGQENRQVQANFPIRSSATEVLFLQHIIASLKATGRGAVVVPDGVLFDDEVAFHHLRTALLSDLNLHTIVRLPPGCFPYTPHQRVNLLFFDKSSGTTGIWYYEQPVPSDRRHLKHPRYTKTRPLRYEDFEELLQWWGDRHQTEWAWYVPVGELDQPSMDLDRHHPDRPPAAVIPDLAGVTAELKEAGANLDNLASFVSQADGEATWSLGHPTETISIGEARVRINPESADPRTSPDRSFIYIDLSAVDRGAIRVPDPILGRNAPSRARRRVREGDVLFSTVRPYLRGHAVVPLELDDSVASTGFAVLRPPPNLDPHFLLLALMAPAVVQQCLDAMKGAHYPALKRGKVRELRIPRPPTLEEQRAVCDEAWAAIHALGEQRIAVAEELADLIDSIKDAEFSLLSRASR